MSLDSVMAGGGKILIVGARESNVPEFWNDPRCVFLEGSEINRRGLPANIRAVCITRFVQHSQIETLMRVARERHLTLFPHINTGALKTTLADLLRERPIKHIEPPKPVVAPRPPAPTMLESISEPLIAKEPDMTKRAPKGQLTAQIMALLTEHPEWKVPDLRKALPQFGESSINSAFYRIKKAGPNYQPRITGLIGPLPAPAPPPASDLVRLIDDAITALQLVREAATQDQTRRAELQKLLEHFKTL